MKTWQQLLFIIYYLNKARERATIIIQFLKMLRENS